MKINFLNLICTLVVLLPVTIKAQQPEYLISAPAGNQFTHIDRNGTTVIPNGRLLTPLGVNYTVAPHPYGLALSNDGSIAVTANSGIQPLAITILRNIKSGNPEIQQVPPGPKTDGGVLASVFMGLAVSPDNKVVYVSGGQENKVFIFDIQTGARIAEINCGFKDSKYDYTHGYIGDMVLSQDGKRLYAVDQIGFRMIILDTESKKLISSVPVGRYPYGIALSPDEKTVFVANVGMYKYSLIKRKNKGEWKNGTMDFPAFAYESEEAEEGIHSDSLEVPGLGPVNSDESFSVWAVSLKNDGKPKVTAKIKTGNLVGQMVEGFPAVGGSSPNSIVATNNYVFISNGNNDMITVLNVRNRKMVSNIRLSPDHRIDRLRGIIPFGLAVSPDSKRIYAAESGINAVAIIDAEHLKVLGHIPVGWFPAKLKVTPDGKKLVVANAKGFGSGPNGGPNFRIGPEGSYIGSIMKGTVEVLDIPADDQLDVLTARVMDNNFRFASLAQKKQEVQDANPIPLFPGQKDSPIKHIIFISKENRTFDEIFGQMKTVSGDSTLARFGHNVTFTNHDKSRKVENATVAPNHLKLASQFGLGDNFYVDSDVSADGHRWLVNTYPNEWVESTTPANYGGNREYRDDSKAPGNLGLNGASGAIYPEDYNEAGSMWDHLARHHVEYFNFGFSVMFEPADYQDTYKYGGIKQVANFPLPTSLFSRTSHDYPTFNMAIPDQFRVDIFKKEFSEKWNSGKDTLPELITLILPNDHGAGERPDAGYAFRESYMADNDLALGRLVEFLSHSPYWKNMAIVVTEDDAQNGVDHVDAHRSVLMVISPYAKPGYISHVHHSFGSIFKTFWNILELPYLNQFDAGATDLSDFFTSKPDFTPYLALPVDARFFDPQKALDPFDEKFNWEQLHKGPEIDNPQDMIRESKEQDEWRKEMK
ncbi:MAG: bifunctional YncE family protein/alkaline phosphatase family protein [Bacteroidetes bacterium]|nr:bifunctional YncE family protein/alkaline phosphatase family protein [Bacteroidota bacterium]